MNLGDIFQKVISQKQKLIIPVIIFLLLATLVILWQLGIFGYSDNNSGSNNKNINEMDVIFEGEPSYVFTTNQTGRLGSLQINFFDAKDVSYNSRELDENYQRIVKEYLAIQIKVFNSSFDETENLLIGLIDENGNKYLLDKTAYSNFPDMKGYGWNKNIFPRIIQEGYVFFEKINENSKNFQLIFALELTKEKIAFNFER